MNDGKRYHAHKPISLAKDIAQFIFLLVIAAAILAMLSLDGVTP